MTQQKYWVVGNTHVDLAWKKDRHEMIELLDILLARLLDMLDSHPTFTYTIEQATHYRLLAVRRPDLFERIKHYVQEGRLEMVGGMASTLETNFPNGESFVRNQLIGLRWVKAHLGVDVHTPWLIDTFGMNAQIPQILKQFGFRRLMANRFGGNVNEDVFWAQGLDGTKLLIVGKDVNSPYVKSTHLFWGSARTWDQVDQLFTRACAAEGAGPFMVTTYTENEVLPSLRPDYFVQRGNAGGQDGVWQFGTLSGFFDALEATNYDWPVMHGDLNPEFTATFSQRILIRVRNRAVETLLLAAEKWAALTGLDGWQDSLEEAWWELAYVHFHDVFTGSHPTKVLVDVLASLDKVEAIARSILDRALSQHNAPMIPLPGAIVVQAHNGLPWVRTDLVTIPLSYDLLGVESVLVDEREVPFDIHAGQVRVMATLPPMGSAQFMIKPGADTSTTTVSISEPCTIENEFILVECDSGHLIKRLVWKETGAVLLENASDLITVQRDNGSFQIEDLYDDEIPATVGSVTIVACAASAIAQRVILRGAFPQIVAVGDEGFLTWEAELEVRQGKPALYVQLRLGWHGEASRVRFNLATNIKSFDGIYEIPFGTVHRHAYRERKTAKGEWPAHRFVAIEDAQYGVALINTGAAGVEITGGRISSTILRAPKSEYAGMVVDDTSSQHGQHAFHFAVCPYAGRWYDAGVTQFAQEINERNLVMIYPNQRPQPPTVASWMTLSPSTVVLSAVKASPRAVETAHAGELIVRIYETAGHATSAELWIHGAQQAWKSDLREASPGETLRCRDERITIPLQPFEIVTIMVQRQRVA